jgi:hypothetical protein
MTAKRVASAHKPEADIVTDEFTQRAERIAEALNGKQAGAHEPWDAESVLCVALAVGLDQLEAHHGRIEVEVPVDLPGAKA